MSARRVVVEIGVETAEPRERTIDVAAGEYSGELWLIEAVNPSDAKRLAAVLRDVLRERGFLLKWKGLSHR